MNNFILKTDSYKLSHFEQYREDTEAVYSHIVARKHGVRLFNVQGILNQISGMVVTRSDVDEAERFVEAHGMPFNRAGWLYIVDKHDGHLPAEIRSLPEGSWVPEGVPMVTIVNTDPACYWLTSYLETMLLRAIWYGSSVCTTSFSIKMLLEYFLLRTSDNVDASLMLQDFGARGAASGEAAAIAGAAHLVNFLGSDTLEGIEYLMNNYDAPVCGFSVPAAEHSTMTSEGEEGEYEVLKRILRDNPTGIVSVVGDSFSIDRFVDTYVCDWSKEEILGRDGKFVVRPDSGDPVKTPVRVVEKLLETFGYTLNSKGYKVLNPKVGVLQGDGIGYDDILEICRELASRKISIECMVFGMGGGLHQKVNRDSYGFAMKASAIRRSGTWYDVKKVTPGKNSLGGRFKVNPDMSVERATSDNDTGLLKPVFRNGKKLNPVTLDDVKSAL